MLPPINGVKPHISGSTYNSYRARPRTNNTHSAVDFNYTGGQGAAPNRSLPPVYAPVSGTVTKAGGSYGMVAIKDDKGLSHEILHMIKISVRAGQRIEAGTMIGRMAGKGPGGDFAYAIHVHYQLRDPKYNQRGGLIDPVAYWDNNKQVFTEPLSTTDENVHAGDEGHYNEEPSAPYGNVEEYIPRQAGVSSPSDAQIALWTNRVPAHEPWNRVMMVDTKDLNGPTDEIERNVNHNPQFTDDSEEGSKMIGQVEGEETTIRGPFWRR